MQGELPGASGWNKLRGEGTVTMLYAGSGYLTPSVKIRCYFGTSNTVDPVSLRMWTSYVTFSSGSETHTVLFTQQMSLQTVHDYYVMSSTVSDYFLLQGFLCFLSLIFRRGLSCQSWSHIHVCVGDMCVEEHALKPRDDEIGWRHVLVGCAFRQWFLAVHITILFNAKGAPTA